MRYNLAILLNEWRRADGRLRYFLLTHALANLGIVLASGASVAAGFLDQPLAQLILLAVAALCAGQAMLSWGFLQRQFKDRYSLL